MGNERAKIITFYTRKGGVGKTTVAINLAVALTKEHYKIFGKNEIEIPRILLVDNDSQANLTEIMLPEYTEDYWRNKDTIKELYIERNVSADDVIRKTIYKNIDIIPSCLRHGDTNSAISTNPSASYILTAKLEPILDKYDYVIIDNNPQVDALISNALLLADVLVAPSETFRFSISILEYLENQIYQANVFRTSGLKKAPLKKKIFLNKIDLRSKSTNDAISNALSEAYGDEFMDSKIRLNIMYPGNINEGQSIFDDKTNNETTRAVKKEFINFAKELIIDLQQ